ncbi:MAG: hypothetical protein K8T20_10495, partial [Planctomycetes bacterium]|nr:hypothetical protein [Planctomycetota bacterium]
RTRREGSVEAPEEVTEFVRVAGCLLQGKAVLDTSLPVRLGWPPSDRFRAGGKSPGDRSMIETGDRTIEIWEAEPSRAAGTS